MTKLFYAFSLDTRGLKFILIWNKVLIGKKNYGWILRVIPATIGVPEKRMTISYKFYFKYIDLFTLFIGSIGFIWGFLNFRLRPV